MKKNKLIRFLIFLLISIFLGFQLQGDDKELFMGFDIDTNIVRPNVIILMDNSGSMNTIIFYPKKGLDRISGTDDDGFDPNITYTGYWENYNQVDQLSETQWIGRWISGGNAYEYSTGELDNIDGENHWTGCYEGDGSPDNFRVGSNGTQYFNEGERIMFEDTSYPYYDAVATIKSKYTDDSGNTWFELEDIVGGPITVNGGNFQRCPDSKTRVPVVIQLYGISDYGYSVRYPDDYIKWMYIHANADQQAAISHFSTWGTFDVNSEPEPELSNCATPGNNHLDGPHPRLKVTYTRIQTAREVICHVSTNYNPIVKLGLFKFSNNNGSIMMDQLNDMSDESSLLVQFKDHVWGIPASTWTPLAEALADVWYYYKPGPGTQKTYWPVDYEIEHNLVHHNPENAVDKHRIEYWCQKSYVVLMTDGESTMDRFDDYSKWGDSIFRQKPVKRSEPWNSWDDGWGDTDNVEGTHGVPTNYNPNGTYCPNYTCWYLDSGSDYLDDVAYFMKNQDLYPDDFFGTDPNDGWPGDQNIFTYTIGFNADNHMLLQTAVNGDGAYYTATNYDELLEAFHYVITSINLRNFGFASITAPRKTATASDEDLTVSYVGYFMPSQAASIWEGHLLAFRLIDAWGFDVDNSGEIEEHEYVYDTREQCLEDSNGSSCVRTVTLPIGHEWDARDKIPLNRNLYTNIDSSNLPFTLTNRDTLRPYFGTATTDVEAEKIITTIRNPQLGDIFHSDVAFIGPPSYGKQFRRNINPPNTNDETYASYYEDNKNRVNVLYTGTNDGIFHMFNADGEDAGDEVWGLIPDAVLPSLRTIAIDLQHTYTADGRISANDVYFQKEGQSFNSWSTILTHGLRRGGDAFYTFDVTEVGSEPDLLWKYEDSTFSGQSWGKPLITKVRLKDPNNTALTIDKYVIFLTGGFAYNSEYSLDQQGKAIFMVDAGTGDLLWMIGYDITNGATDESNSPDTEKIEMYSSDGIRYYTSSDYFNFPIPTSLTAIDKDGNDFADALYFGNIGGHLFKTDISNFDTAEWTTYLIYKTEITTKATSTIASINDVEFTMNSLDNFEVGDAIIGETSHAYGYIRRIEEKDGDTVFSVETNKGTFQTNETIFCRTYDPIYLSPALTYDTCNQIWIIFGTGDRDRPRSANHIGKFIAIKDVGNTNLTTSNLSYLTWGSTNEDSNLPKSELTSSKGWYFNFGDNYEKLFDPDPVVLPDEYGFPHIYFNTYQPPTSTSLVTDNPCAAPQEGNMLLYNIALTTCGVVDTIEGERTTGRIAGGGVYNSKEYVLYTSTSGDVADVPGEDDMESWPVKLFDPFGRGSFIFWKEKKR